MKLDLLLLFVRKLNFLFTNEVERIKQEEVEVKVDKDLVEKDNCDNSKKEPLEINNNFEFVVVSLEERRSINVFFFVLFQKKMNSTLG